MSKLPWEHPRFANWIAVAKVHSLWQQRLAAGVALHGLKLAQFDILANLVYEPGMTQQRLAEKLFVGRSNLSMALPDLERLGWLRRDADAEDRRVRRLYLTPEGDRLARLALVEESRIFAEMMDVLSDEECNRVGEYFRRMAERLKALPPPGAALDR